MFSGTNSLLVTPVLLWFKHTSREGKSAAKDRIDLIIEIFFWQNIHLRYSLNL